MRSYTYTVLRRKEATWDERIVSLLVHNLVTEAVRLPSMPEYLALVGRYERRQILDAMGGGGWVGEALQYVEAESHAKLFVKIQEAEQSVSEAEPISAAQDPVHYVDRAGVDDYDGTPESDEE